MKKKVKCPECEYEDDNPITFREHVEENHLDSYYQYTAWLERHNLYYAFLDD